MSQVKRLNYILLTAVLLYSFAPAYSQYIPEYNIVAAINNADRRIHSITYGYITQSSTDTSLNFKVKYFYSNNRYPDSAIVHSYSTDNAIKLVYIFEGDKLNEKKYYINDSLYQQVQIDYKDRKVISRTFGYNKKGAFKLAQIEFSHSIGNHLTIIKERYLWPKKNLRYYLLGRFNRIWHYYKRESFIYHEVIKTSRSNQRLQLRRGYINSSEVFEISFSGDNSSFQECHHIWYDKYDNGIRPQLVIRGTINTSISIIEYEKITLQ